MRSYSLALFISTLTVVSLTADSQVPKKYSSLRDAALAIHPCLESTGFCRVETNPSNRSHRIRTQIAASGACETAVSFECNFDQTDQMYSCHSLDNHDFDLSFGAPFGPDPDVLYDAPVHSRTPTALQLIQDEMTAAVARE
jgi:hypothetical protein